MTSPDGAGVPPNEDVGGWGGDYGPLSILTTFGNYLIMRPLDRLLSGLLGTPAGSFDTVEELVQDLIPAIIRKVLRELTGVLGGGGSSALDPADIEDIIESIPVVGDIAKALQGISSGISGALQGGADFISGIVRKHQNLNNQIWSGATQQPLTEDQIRTEKQVREAVSALKARSDVLQTESELRYSSSVPLWQGLIPGGDVTTEIAGVTTDEWIQVGSEELFQKLGSVNSTEMVFSLFRARSTVQRDFISFVSRSPLVDMTDFRVGLWTYRYEEDKWEMVARSGNISSLLSETSEWVDAPLVTPYSPSDVGELMAVSWWSNGGQTYLASSRYIYGDNVVPAYHSVPYGNAVFINTATSHAPGNKLSLPSSLQWSVVGVPFAQVAPNLGQAVDLRPQYWFDDFNSYAWYNGSGSIGYSGDFRYQGTSDGVQNIYLTTQMSTDRVRAEASAGGSNASPIELALHCDGNGQHGVRVAITSAQVKISTGGAYDPGVTKVTVGNSAGAARWSLEFFPDTNTYVVQKGGTTVASWIDSANEAHRGRGRRGAGLQVSRTPFLTSPAWDDFLVFDVTD